MKNSKKFLISCILLTTLFNGCSLKKQEATITPTEPPISALPSSAPLTETPTQTLTPTPSLTLSPTEPVTKIPLSPTITLPETPSPKPTVLLPTLAIDNPTTESPTQPANTPTISTPTKKPTPLPTKPPAKVSVSPMPTPDIPAYTDEEFEYFKNAWLPSVELSEVNFPDEVFRELISKIVDKNKDGILTLEERKTLTYLRDAFFTADLEHDEPYDEKTNDYQMANLLPKVRDLTGIEYFPQLKIIYMLYGRKSEKLCHPINLNGLPNLEIFYFSHHYAMPENTYSFNFEHLPKLKNIEIEIKNLDSVSYLSFNDTTNLQEFRITGNVASLDGLEQTNVQKMLLKFEKISGEFSFFSREASQLTCDLTEFKNLNELHIYVPEIPETYILRDGASLETLGLNASGSTVIFHHMPKLQDVRVLGASAVKNEDCPNLEVLRTAMSENLECLDLSSFSNLKVLGVSWCSMALPSIILPSDAVDIATLRGKTQTSIICQEQPVFKKMQQTFQTALEQPVTLSGAAIEYEKISDESLSTSGIYEFICTPEHGYQIDLDGDGISEELYTDSKDFYINGIGLNISRHNYKRPTTTPWEVFWIKVSGDTQTRQLILNTAPLERYYYALYGAPEVSLLEDYWVGGNDTLEWGEKADMKHFIDGFCIGQFLLSYDGELHLRAYAEGDFRDYDKKSISYPFVEAEYNLEEVSFSHINDRWMRIYGTKEIPSLYFQNDM